MRNRLLFIRFIGPSICLFFFLYLSHQLFRFAGFPPLILVLLMAWIFFLFLSLYSIIVLVWLSPTRRESKHGVGLQRLTYLIQGYLSYLMFLVALRDVVFLVLRIFGIDFFAYDQDEAFIILLGPPLLMALGRISLWTGPWRREVKIKEENLSKDLDSFKIAQISDLHIGLGISIGKIKETVAMANDIEADVIVLTGDIVDQYEHVFVKEISELKHLKAKHGVYFVPGNHEYYWEFKPIIERIRSLGIHVLLNENRIIKVGQAQLAICGVCDVGAAHFNMEGPDFKKAAQGTEKCDYRILLSHQPKTADEAKDFGFQLQLSGHTHGGQFIPWSLLIRLFQKYTTGLFQVGKMKLYVNRGTGHWGPPDRLGTYSEITELILWQV
jgi:predicted MPP superfamily phosphohydrolase